MDFASLGMVLAMSLSSLSFSIVPRQGTPEGCGYAAAAGMLRLLSGTAVEEKAFPRREPASLKDIALVLEEEGFPTLPGWTEPSSILPLVRRFGPAILHLASPSPHYILAIGAAGEQLLAADPSWGARLFRPEEIMRRSSGYLILAAAPQAANPFVVQAEFMKRRLSETEALAAKGAQAVASRNILLDLGLSVGDGPALRASAELGIPLSPVFRLRLAAFLNPESPFFLPEAAERPFAFEAGLSYNPKATDPRGSIRLGAAGGPLWLGGEASWTWLDHECAASLVARGGRAFGGPVCLGGGAQILLGIRPDLAFRAGGEFLAGLLWPVPWRVEVSWGIIIALARGLLCSELSSFLGPGAGESKRLRLSLSI